MSFESQLVENSKELLTEEQINLVASSANKYMSINNTASGKEFFEKFILASCKDYPTDDMRYYQSLTELKSRLGRVFDDTISLKKKELELELLELDLEDHLALDDKRSKIHARMVSQDILQKSAHIEFAKNNLASLMKEVEQFNSICDKLHNFVKPFEEARVEEMEKKIEARYINFVVHGVPLSSSEMSLYYNQDGILVPPKNAIEKLEKLGYGQIAHFENDKLERIEQAIDKSSKLLLK